MLSDVPIQFVERVIERVELSHLLEEFEPAVAHLRVREVGDRGSSSN
jgi:hypothetical protein